MSVWKQRHYDGSLSGQWASQGRERQPSICARSIWTTVFMPFQVFLIMLHKHLRQKDRNVWRRCKLNSNPTLTLETTGEKKDTIMYRYSSQKYTN